MTLVQDWQKDIFGMVKFDEFLSNLKNCRIADIGHIEAIVDSGRFATVRLLDGSNQLLKAEIFGPFARSGQYCLLIIPATPFDLSKAGLDVAERSYASTYAKCFPLQSPTFSSVKLNHDTDTFSLSTPTYTFQCDSEGIAAIDSRGFSVALKEGALSIANNKGNADVVFDDEGIKIETGNSYTEEDGKVTKTVLSVDDTGVKLSYQKEDTDEPQTVLSVDETGVHVSEGEDKKTVIDLTSDGISIAVGDDTSINIDTEGKATIAVTELKLTGDVTIDGKLKVTGAVTMDDTLSVAKNFDAAGKNLTADSSADSSADS